ncbi:aminotransferase class I/II-fold pyridoxal phosphate-dependent enzyme [Flavobacterium agricola]|uniref:Aminotransferase n=1 Tax=Flavobacterium agricola TaxID=2870839 RepID=A0ABY6LWA9_9FLAO|nr:aminotransferase class I/II-fold pyridoxal phosphate-dependent enzyme [Flavobacterium agricola]UYW00619.1 aminotransferase class I/II-fold pyridoxal phosphate-dependent enzyme [Flavobacterium agricola]
MIEVANRLHSTQEYYFSVKLREVAQMLSEGKKVINLGIGSPDLDPHPSVIQAITEAMNDPKAHQYQSYQGLLEMRQAMANFYKKFYNVNLDPHSEILPLMGSKEGIMHIALAFLNPGDKVLVPNPGYPTYQSVLNIVDAEAVYYDLTEASDWEPDFDAIEAQGLAGVKLMFTNYPHMPTGAAGSKALYQKIVDFAKKHNILLVNDNPYSFILNDNPLSILDADGAKDIAIELNSLSKTFNMAGWRVGMVVGAKYFIDAILKVKSNMDSGMFYGIQKGAIQALSLDTDWFSSLNKIYKKRKQKIIELAHLLDCEVDAKAVGMFVWAKLPLGSASATEIIDYQLQNNHIFITPGSIFGSNGNNYIRFSLCLSEQLIDEAIARVKQNKLITTN